MSPSLLADPPRVALITGSAQGIGKGIALRLAQEGIYIALNDIPQKQAELDLLVSEINAMGSKAISVPADVSNEEQVKAMIQKTVDSLGSLDIMVANAGLCKPGRLVDFSVADFDQLVAVNLRGVMLCYKYAGIQMIKQGRGGRIIGASSIAGRKGPPNLAAYGATKWAIRGMTHSFAMEMAPYNVTVNVYVPGAIMTPMSMSPINHMAGLPPDAPHAYPDVIASLVAYLTKPEAYFITGMKLSY
ncbi:NAD(P)-binding protein [Panus rudis PR-1116 ss-1]|nr:NAD(P)-binding protein [Panus rudis PR-1116 ss-1]